MSYDLDLRADGLLPMSAPKTAKDFEDLYLAEAAKVKHMRKALEFYAHYSTWIGNATDQPFPRIHRGRCPDTG